MEATSIDGLVAHCQKARFTGILRMRAKEGIGEIWFLSGITDEMQFGTSEGDEALGRMRKATDATYELVPRLPHPGGGFKQRFPMKGSVSTATPVTLMRYCEQYALTCTLSIESKNVLVEARYEMGDLVTVETTADDDGITAMLEATEGTYELKLPDVELPEGTPVLPPASSSIMESIPPPAPPGGLRELLATQPLVGRQASNEAEVKRKTVEVAHKTKAAEPKAVTPKPSPVIIEKKTPTPAAAAPVVEKKAPVIVEKKTTPSPKAPVVEKKAPVVAEKKTPAPAAPVAKKAPVVEEKKTPVAEEKKPEPVVTEEKKPAPVVEETKPAAVVEEKKPAAEEEKKPVEEKKAPVAEEKKPAVEEEEKEEVEDEADEKEEPSEKPAPAPIAAKRSYTWLVVPLLFAAAVIYLLWSNRL
jgi:hypothetical protein